MLRWAGQSAALWSDLQRLEKAARISSNYASLRLRRAETAAAT